MTGPAIMDGIGDALILLSAVQLAASIKAYRGDFLRGLGAMTCVSLRSSKLLLFMVSIVSLLNALFPNVLSLAIPTTQFQLGIAFVGIDVTCLPPAILYLAATTKESQILSAVVSLRVMPLKLVHLLDPWQQIEQKLSNDILIRLINFNRYRVWWNWEHAVRSLSKISSCNHCRWSDSFFARDDRTSLSRIRREARSSVCGCWIWRYCPASLR